MPTLTGGAGGTSGPGEEPSPITTAPRPQRDVPGFEGLLTCCTDWPQTRKGGGPPGAQSAIFNPLLACVIGPIEGHCTAEELALAHDWWTAALPAWPRWVESLLDAGVASRRPALLAGSKGKANPLIPKARGRGTVPHFNGRAQNDALEMEPGVAVEVYACVACMYSSRACEDPDEAAVGRDPGASAGGASGGEALGQRTAADAAEARRSVAPSLAAAVQQAGGPPGDADVRQ